ncbi:NAD(P)/FAD-dependent oxidoreductase [Hwanghaeella sp.]|uniref:NAD(P)/FAD-dependent oxidoreductase n=1 Tax=Hwanghaeella sp. TaxID=2605943 RepID=UPI003CCB8364
MNASDEPLSYYRASANAHTGHPALQGDIDVDVCVVGAGYTGLSAALDLALAGYSVAVLEANVVGYGASGRNGGQICSGYSNSMERIEERIGKEDAAMAWQIVDEAVELVGQRVADHGIDCDLKWGYMHLAGKQRQADDLEHMAEEYTRFGHDDIRLLDKAAVREKIGSDAYVGGLWEKRAGHVHPLNYCLGLADAAVKAGAKIFENSPVISVDTGDAPKAHTANGTVSAKFMVLGGNAYLRDTVPFLYRRLMPVQSYILATEPLSENMAKSLLPGDEAVADCNFIVNYFRLSGDRRMLFGGRASYSTLQPSDLFSFMKPRMTAVFPQLGDAKLDYCWGGYIGITVDRMPHFGRLGPSTYFAQGFSGHGLSLSGMAGRLMAEAIKGQSERFDVMAKFKHPIFPGGRFRTPALVLAMVYYRLKDMLP